MKKIILTLFTAVAFTFIFTSCRKDDTPPNNSSVQGSWTGTGQYGTSGGNPTYAFTLNFKADGSVDITGDNSVGADVATGTWTMVADSVRATYKYAGSSAIYTLSGKYTSGTTVMNGTIGLSPQTAGTGIFTVTRQ